MPSSADATAAPPPPLPPAAGTTVTAPPPTTVYRSPSLFRRFPYPYFPLSTAIYLATIIICIYLLSAFQPLWQTTHWSFLITSWALGLVAASLSLLQALILFRLHMTHRLHRRDIAGFASILLAGFWLAVIIVSWTWYDPAGDVHKYKPEGYDSYYHTHPYYSSHTSGGGRGLFRRSSGSGVAGTGMFSLVVSWTQRYNLGGSTAIVGAAFAGVILVTASS